MEFLEKDLEDIIFNTPNGNLIERGLWIRGLKRRQIHIGNYGRLDLVTISRDAIENKLIITVYELKQKEINWESLHQASKYVRGIQRWLEKVKGYSFIFDDRIEIRIVIIGKSICFKSAFCYTSSVFENVKLYTYTYNFDGIVFKDEYDYKLNNEGF